MLYWVMLKEWFIMLLSFILLGRSIKYRLYNTYMHKNREKNTNKETNTFEWTSTQRTKNKHILMNEQEQQVCQNLYWNIFKKRHFRVQKWYVDTGTNLQKLFSSIWRSVKSKTYLCYIFYSQLVRTFLVLRIQKCSILLFFTLFMKMLN